MNQDFLAFRRKREALCFAICDGVGQSFFGDLASRFVGLWLLDWLSGLDLKIADERRMVECLREGLAGLKEKAEGALEKVRLPENTPELVRSVMEEKRRLGSQATFAGGRIELFGSKGVEGRYLLAWLGNIRVRTGDDKGWGGMLDPQMPLSRSAWSSSADHGDSLPGLAIADLRIPPGEGIRVIAYTDGLSVLDTVFYVPDDHELGEMILSQAKGPRSDDCSFIEVEISDRTRPRS